TLTLNGTDITVSATLAGTVIAPGLSLTVPVTLAANTTIDTSANNGSVTLATIDGTTAGGQSLTITSGSGAVTFTGNIGGTKALGAFTTATTGQIQIGSAVQLGGFGTITTAGGAITFNGNVLLNITPTFDTTAGGTVSAG